MFEEEDLSKGDTLPNWKFTEILKDQKIHLTKIEYRKICKLFSDGPNDVNYTNFLEKIEELTKKETLKFTDSNLLKGFYRIIREEYNTVAAFAKEFGIDKNEMNRKSLGKVFEKLKIEIEKKQL